MPTASEFIASRHELDENGRWTELVAGEVIVFNPPEDRHGAVVLNFAKALSEWVTSTGNIGATCHDIGLQTATDPDTLRFPSLAFFRGKEAFARLDELVATTVPALVIEVASTADRVATWESRAAEYAAMPADAWLVDLTTNTAEVISQSECRTISEEDPFFAKSLQDLSPTIDKMLQIPEW